MILNFIKFKRFLYLLLSFSCISSLFLLSLTIANSVKENILGYVFFTIVLFLAFNFLLLLLTFLATHIKNRNDDVKPFTIGIFSIFFLPNKKWIYHSELGYFLITISEDNIIGYQQNIFYMKEIFKTHTDNNVDYISNSIKSKLDFYYEDLIIKERKKKVNLEKIDRIKKWDGYLDKVSRRDGKINNLLK